MNSSYLAKVDAFIRPFLDKNGYYLIKSEFVNEDSVWYLRLYIDLTEDEIKKRSGADTDSGANIGADTDVDIDTDIDVDTDERIIPGIDIADCAKVSRTLSKWLDKEDFISETYTLEVCSKGFLKESEQPGV